MTGDTSIAYQLTKSSQLQAMDSPVLVNDLDLYSNIWNLKEEFLGLINS